MTHFRRPWNAQRTPMKDDKLRVRNVIDISQRYLECQRKLDSMKIEAVAMRARLAELSREYDAIGERAQNVGLEMQHLSDDILTTRHEAETEIYLVDMVRQLDEFGRNIRQDVYYVDVGSRHSVNPGRGMAIEEPYPMTGSRSARFAT